MARYYDISKKPDYAFLVVDSSLEETCIKCNDIEDAYREAKTKSLEDRSNMYYILEPKLTRCDGWKTFQIGFYANGRYLETDRDFLHCGYIEERFKAMEKEDGNTQPWRDCDYNIKEK